MLSYSVLNRYIISEVAKPFFIALFVFTGSLFLIESLKLIELVVVSNVPIFDIILVFLLVIPGFLELTLPMALLIGVVVAFSRMSSDSEIVVFRASGVSLWTLAVPVMFFSILITFAALAMSTYIRPYSSYKMKSLIFDIVQKNTSASLVPGTFSTLGKITIYADQISNNGESLKGVIIGDNRDSQRVFVAKSAKVNSNKRSQSISIKLYDGSIHEVRENEVSVTDFKSNGINLSFGEVFSGDDKDSGKGRKEHYMHELMQSIKERKEALKTDMNKEDLSNYRKYRNEFQKRIAIPLSCLFVGLLAVSLGIQPSRSENTWGTSISLLLGVFAIVLYYILLAVCSSLAKDGNEPYWVYMWIPNIVMTLLAIRLFWIVATQRWRSIGIVVSETLLRLAGRFISK